MSARAGRASRRKPFLNKRSSASGSARNHASMTSTIRCKCSLVAPAGWSQPSPSRSFTCSQGSSEIIGASLSTNNMIMSSGPALASSWQKLSKAARRLPQGTTRGNTPWIPAFSKSRLKPLRHSALKSARSPAPSTSSLRRRDFTIVSRRSRPESNVRPARALCRTRLRRAAQRSWCRPHARRPRRPWGDPSTRRGRRATGS